MSDVKIGISSYGFVSPKALFDSTSGEIDCEYDPKLYLKNRKDLKFLSKQDALALTAASRAWEGYADKDTIDPNRVGIYLGVGILPFEDGPLDKLSDKSTKDGAFDMELFSTESFKSMSPLLTFKCLPNMPLFHISYNLGLTGRYYMTYPGLVEWFNIVKRALGDLKSGLVDCAMVGAIADQKNFLVQNHLQRVIPERASSAIDSAAVFILKRIEGKSIGIKAVINDVDIDYHSFDPLQNKEFLFPTQDKLSLFSGIVEPSLFFIEQLENRTTGELTYTTNLGDISLKLNMELL